MTQAKNSGKGMVKIGGVWLKNENKKKKATDPDSFSIKLGQDQNTDPKYNLSVELVVKNSAGEVVAHQTDGWVTLKDPRFSDFLTDEQKAKIPKTLQFDVLVGKI
jgi:hypothetical protein